MKTVTCILLFLVCAQLAQGQIPKTMSYQGRLLQNGAPVADGSYNVAFRLYLVASGGVAQWSEAQTVTTRQGLFSVVLGSVTPLDLVFDRPYWLAMSISGGAELTPRTRLAATAYSLYANTVIDNSISTAKLVDNSVTTAKVLPNILSSIEGVTNDGGNIDLIAGTNITITPSDAANTITIAATGTAGGDISGVTAGAGLSGGGTSGDVTLSVAVPLSLTAGVPTPGALIKVDNTGTGHGVIGRAAYHAMAGVLGESTDGPGVKGETHGGEAGGVQGYSTVGYGVHGYSVGSWGVYAVTENGSSSAVVGHNHGNGNVGVLADAPAGVRGYSTDSAGVKGESTTGFGVSGKSTASFAVIGQSNSGTGVCGQSETSFGVMARTMSANASALYADNSEVLSQAHLGSARAGVLGFANDTVAVEGASLNNAGVLGTTSLGWAGVHGRNDKTNGIGVYGEALNGSGAYGVSGYSPSGLGVVGTSGTNNGVYGASISGTGVYGYSNGGTGIYGLSILGDGLYGEASAASKSGVFAKNTNASGYAGYFLGRVHVTGTLSKGAGAFKIDHPLDPANKYLQHSFVESPDMMNVYNGNVTLDASGQSIVILPDWFEALNKDFRYQLTCIGGFAPVYVAQEVSGNQFRIAGGSPSMKVSWQVTGIRRDAYAEAHRIEVEVDKTGSEQGKYLYPAEQGVSEALGMDYERIQTTKSELAEGSHKH